MRRVAAALMTVALAVAAPAAEALTVRDIIELSRAGLGEDVLLALIDVDGGVYAIDPGTLKTLQESGVSQKVIVALVRSGRERPAIPPPLPAVVEEPAAQPPAPQVVVIEHHESQAPPVYVPVYIGVPVSGHQPRRTTVPPPAADARFVPFQSGTAFIPPQEPVYWGFGGKLRPDAWGQPSKAVPDAGQKK